MSRRRKFDEWAIVLGLLGFAEIEALYHFVVDRHVQQFLIVSAFVLPLAATVIWIQPIVRKGVTNFQICMVIGIGCGAFILWDKGLHFPALVVGILTLTGAGILAYRLIRKVDASQQEAYVKAYRAEAASVHPVVQSFLSFVSCVVLGWFLWASEGYPRSIASLILVLFPIWFAWRIIFHLFIKRDDSDHADSPIERES